MLKSLFSQFQTRGTYQSAEPYGSGHINDTYLVQTTEAHCPNYIFQRINHHVFQHPQAMMNNIVLVTEHIRNKLNPYINSERECLTVIKSTQQFPAVTDEEGFYWACYLYINDSHAHDLVTNTKQAREGGKLIGRFLNHVSDFPHEALHETLPNFHNVDFRLENFERAVKENNFDRVQQCQSEIEFVRSIADEMKLTMSLGEQGKIPLRVVHNDTKFNNILLDSDDNGLCLIDLDTVMPGYLHYDFSDAVRTIANSSAEDEKDLRKISFDMNLFSAFCTGFIGEIKHNLNSAEINSLARAAPLMPFLHGMRFLTDHLTGDGYYKIHFPGHNLQRAQAQFQLIRCIQENISEMHKIICNLSH